MSMRIENMFARCAQENRKALIVYTTMGCPTIEDSEKLVNHQIAQGADLIELGVPFSDPMADGPTIQEAGQIALKNGATLAKILDSAARIRQQNPDTPLIVFSYLNVLLSYGVEKLTQKLEDIGVDGLLIVDLPMEERSELIDECRKHDLVLIPLLSPATGSERAKAITKDMKGFAYCITVRGVTGARSELPAELADELIRFKSDSAPLPIAAGFGISSPEMAKGIAKYADSIVVGSAAVKLVLEAEDAETGIENCGKFIAQLAEALR